MTQTATQTTRTTRPRYVGADRAKLTKRVTTLRKQELTYEVIAAIVGVSRSTVYRLAN